MDLTITLNANERNANDSVGLDEPHGIRVAADEVVFTRLVRPNHAGADEYLQAPPAQLAFWLVDNWWRLRWEGPHGQPTPGWRLSHDLSSIGGGYAWPRLCMWGLGDLMVCDSRADPPGVVGPIRYLTEAQLTVTAISFEEAVSDLVAAVLDRSRRMTSDTDALAAQWGALAAEQADPEISAWRRLEARLGFDVDDAPEVLMGRLGEIAARFDAAGVEEAAMAAPGEESLSVLEDAIAAVRASGVDCDFGHALACLKDIEDQADPAGAFRPASEQPPWVDGEMAAAVLRRETGITHGPLRNRMLSELLQTHPNTFRQTRTIGSSRPYGLRIGSDDGSGRQRLTLQTHSSGSRRFEAARALGDAQWSRRTDASRLGPIGWADTARQRFQRTFAQALLCPYADLDDDLGPGYVDDDRIDAAARHYHVTEGVIRTVLVNKGRIDRDRLPASS